MHVSVRSSFIPRPVSLVEDIMGQKVMGPTVPAGAACGDALINVSSDESVLILINHCRDMKRQEARLRLITLLLLLGCTALFVYSTCANLGQHGKSGSSRDGVSCFFLGDFSLSEAVMRQTYLSRNVDCNSIKPFCIALKS